MKLLSTVKRYIGESTETKPTDCPNGSTVLETDTGNIMVYEKESADAPGIWTLKSEAGITLRLEMKLLLGEILAEAKKSNEYIELVVDSLGE